MTIDDIDPAIREFLFAREAMRRLGFAAEELYFVADTSGSVEDRVTGQVTHYGDPLIGLQLKAQGREWNWVVGLCKLPKDQIAKAFEAAVEIWNRGDVMFERWEQSLAFQNRVLLVTTLMACGFVIDPQGLAN